MADYGKPVPVPTKEDRDFWAAAKRHEFVLPRCRECGHVWFPPYMSCQRCLSMDREWIQASGHGTIDAFTIFDKPYLKAFETDLPYNVVLVLLAEGPRMYSNVIEVENSDLHVGMELEILFDDITPEISLPRFRPR